MATAPNSASTKEDLKAAESPIVFYDGDCGLCSRVVQSVLRRDRSEKIRFAPIQGDTAKELIGPPSGKPEAWAFVLLDEAGVSDRSTASLRILKRVGWGGFMPAIGLAIPRPIRDFVYRLVARFRYRIWGYADRCPLPTPDQRHRFLP